MGLAGALVLTACAGPGVNEMRAGCKDLEDAYSAGMHSLGADASPVDITDQMNSAATHLQAAAAANKDWRKLSDDITGLRDTMVDNGTLNAFAVGAVVEDCNKYGA
jgi:hypothetical protein